MIKSITRSDSSSRTLLMAGAAAVLSIAAMGFSSGAHARGDVSFSVGVSTPGVVFGVSNAYPVYTSPAYGQPVYGYQQQPSYGYHPQPVYVQPQPVYRPHPVYVQAPVYMAPPPVYYRGGHHYRHEGHGHRGHRGHGQGQGQGHRDHGDGHGNGHHR
ncbi:hypothetical protein [Polaromonas eurypsychrophila]|uniref:PXPV repeat-containing protein n=1 Tax=Polaromonas eurypsychrophila TaxID=1614635 RepID=A0A916S6Q4_9BURK|nr:hypothetical protein [Polaromonas eurypsychrophila]GGA86869.1 hypothetical protein GCM10011496_04420 [Polaromonas eurypsychrophila]